MSNIKCNILIIGAGIAGSTCAKALNKLGIDNIIILEQKKGLGISHSQKIDFAEDKGLKKLLKTYELPIYKETNVSRWFAPNNVMFELKSKINDIWIKRGGDNSYENIVLKGIETQFNTQVKRIVKGIVYANNSSTNSVEKYEPKIIIVASGISAPFLNDNKKHMIKPLNGYGFVFNNIDIEPDIPHIFFNDFLSCSSYLFMFQDSKEQNGYLIYGSESNEPLALEEIKTNPIINDSLSSSEIIKKVYGSIYVAQPCTLSRNNILFVGDAANLMDPFLSYGIANSVKSAIFAAEAIASGENINSQYETRVKEEMFSELKLQLKMRKIFNNLDNKDINCIIQLLNDLNDTKDIELLFDNLPKLVGKVTPLLFKNKRILKILLENVGSLL